jgi:hypothetical protein
MFTKLMSSIQLSIRPIDVRFVLFLLMLAMFILGAGAPSATGH